MVRALCALVDELLGGARICAPLSGLARPRAGAIRGELIAHVRDRPGHDRRYAIDYRKARRELGYAPTRDLATGLRETLEWYLANTRLVAGAAGARLCGVGGEELPAAIAP